MKLSLLPEEHGAMLRSGVVSVPNGQGAYRDGSLPCNHTAVFEYADCLRTLIQDKLGMHWMLWAKEAGHTWESVRAALRRRD